MDSKNYTEVLIDGKIYTLGGPEEEGYLQRVASYLNEKISELKKEGGFSRQNIDYQAVMVELNVADDYFKAQERAQALEKEKSEMEKEFYSLKHDLVSAQMKLEAAQKDVKEYKEKLKETALELRHLKEGARRARETAESRDREAGHESTADDKTESRKEAHAGVKKP